MKAARYVRLIKYTGETPINMFNACYSNGNSAFTNPYGSDKAELYTIVNNRCPNMIRRSALHDIPDTETHVIDPNEITGDRIYYELTSDELAGNVLLTTLDGTQPKNVAYMTFNNGHCELDIFIPSDSVMSTGRVVLFVLEDEDNKAIVSTATEGDAIVDSAMRSSSSKVIRVLFNKGVNESDYIIAPYSRLFKDVDLGLLEISSNFDEGLNAKWNAYKTNQYLESKNLRVSDDNQFIFNRGNIIGVLTDSVTL